MKLEIRSIDSGDIDDLSTWVPTAPENVCFQLTIEIGVHGLAGGDCFQAVVATPEGLRYAIDQIPGFQIPDRNILVVSRYSWTDLKKRIERIVDGCARDEWNESVACLERYFQWEYEDYIQE